MGTFDQCIADALAKGEITADAAEVAQGAYEDGLAAADGLGPVEADRFAAASAMSKLEAEALEAKRRKALMLRTRLTGEANAEAHKARMGYDGDQPPASRTGMNSTGGDALAMEMMMAGQGGQAGSGFASVEGRYRALRGKADALFVDGIEAFETKIGYDTPGRAHMPNVVREAFGEDTGDASAASIASGFGEASEWLRQLYNAAGGAIGKLEGWGLPQVHDGMRVRRAAGAGVKLKDVAAHRAAWVARVRPRLDRDKMVDRVTGLPMTDQRLELALGEVWDTIASGGANKRKPGQGMGKGMLAKQRAEARFLVFKSADDWMAYQQEFGAGDIFELMHTHLDDMSKDVAMMQIWGPNPDHQIEWFKNRAKRAAALEEAAGFTGAQKKARATLRQVDDMVLHFTGAANMPISQTLADIGASSRAMMSGVALGSAVVQEAPSNVVFGRMARQFVGLDQNGDMGQLVRLLALPSERAIARRSGFILEDASDGFTHDTNDSLRLMAAGTRAGAKVNGLMRRMPAFTMRISGLKAATTATKRTFHMEFMGMLHDQRERSLKTLLSSSDEETRAFARWLTDRGFTADDWDVIRATPAWEPREGARFIRPLDVVDEDLGLRLSEGIDNETQFVTPEARLWTRARLLGSSEAGTVAGELRRSWVMFRGFSLTAARLYMMEKSFRAFEGRSAAAGFAISALWATEALIYMTLAGAVGTQLREVAKGNDPRPMDDPRFWAAAMMAGGGLSILGDFFYANTARNGRSAPIVAMGPPAQLMADTYDATLGNAFSIALDLASGESLDDALDKADPGRDWARMVRTYSPFASIWWARAGYHRAVADNIQRRLDPEAEEAFERRRRRMERETGQGEWWPAGSNAPERAPDLGLMIGSS